MHDFLRGRFFHTFKPAFEVLLCVGQCFTFKDRLELFSQPPGDADLQVGLLDDFENFVLLLCSILFVFQERMATVHEFLMLLHRSATNLIDPFVEVPDQMKVIVDQTGLGEQLLDRGNVGLPHIRRNRRDRPLFGGRKTIYKYFWGFSYFGEGGRF